MLGPLSRDEPQQRHQTWCRDLPQSSYWSVARSRPSNSLNCHWSQRKFSFSYLPILSWTRHTKVTWASKLQFSLSWLSIIAGRRTISRTPTISSSIPTARQTPKTGPTINSFCFSQLTKNFWSQTSLWRSTQWFVLMESHQTWATRVSHFKLRMWSGTSRSMTTWVGAREPLQPACLHFTLRSSKDWSVLISGIKFLD